MPVIASQGRSESEYSIECREYRLHTPPYSVRSVQDPGGVGADFVRCTACWFVNRPSVDSTDLNSLSRNCLAVLEAASSFCINWPCVGAGHVRWISDAWKQLDHLICRNQTDMRARVHRLLEMLRTYRAAAAALPDAVVVVDCNSQCIQWFNEAANTLLGLRYPSDLDRPVVERLQPLPLASWLTQGCNAESMLDVPSPVNPDVRLNLHLIPYFDDYLLLIARDVSKLLLLEQVKRDFVANVSHELRTPLTVVHGYLDMLDPDDFPDAAPMLMRCVSNRSA